MSSTCCILPVGPVVGTVKRMEAALIDTENNNIAAALAILVRKTLNFICYSF